MIRNFPQSSPEFPPNFPQGDDFPLQNAAFRFELDGGVLHDGIASRMIRQHLQFVDAQTLFIDVLTAGGVLQPRSITDKFRFTCCGKNVS